MAGTARTGNARGARPARRPRCRTATVTAGCSVLLAAVTLAGCRGGSPASALMPKITVDGAYIPQPTTPGSTVGYLDIRNNSGPDRLVSVRTTVGGHVSFLVPDGSRGGVQVMKPVPAITIPAHSTVRLDPTGMRLRITGVGSLRGGKEITLTLTFAHAGSTSVAAQVTDPGTGGGSYLLG